MNFGERYRTIAHSPTVNARKFLFCVHDVGWFDCSPCYGMNRTYYYYQLKFVVRGSGRVVWQNRSFEVRAGDIFFLDLTQKHQYHTNPDDPWELLWVRFDGFQAKAYFDMLGSMDYPIFRTSDPERMKQLFADLYELFRNRPAGLEISASYLITTILTEMAMSKIDGVASRLSDARSGYPNEIQTAVSFIESHYSYPLKIEDIANHVHLSPYYFSRLFRKTTGSTVMEYIMKHRMQQAKRLLADPSHEIGAIAELVGFCNPSYFAKLFARYVGVSPSRYRQSIR